MVFRGGTVLTEVEERAIKQEAERIAAAGSSWEPTIDSLREVVLAVKIAAHEEHFLQQAAGIANARKKGVKLGRPRKEKPDDLPLLVHDIRCGMLSKASACCMLDVSRSTLNRWIEEYEAGNREL